MPLKSNAVEYCPQDPKGGLVSGGLLFEARRIVSAYFRRRILNQVLQLGLELFLPRPWTASKRQLPKKMLSCHEGDHEAHSQVFRIIRDRKFYLAHWLGPFSLRNHVERLRHLAVPDTAQAHQIISLDWKARGSVASRFRSMERERHREPSLQR